MLESPLRIVSRFPRPVRLLLVGTLVNKLGTFVVPYLTLVLLRDFHLREGEAARLLFAFGLSPGPEDPRKGPSPSGGAFRPPRRPEATPPGRRSGRGAAG